MRVRAIIAWAWAFVILGACWYPKRLMTGGDEPTRVFHIPHLDKVVHFGLFAVFAALAVRATGQARAWRVFWIGLALGVVSELGQMTSFVNRDAGLDDLAADQLGVAVALGMMAWLGSRVKAPSPGTP